MESLTSGNVIKSKMVARRQTETASRRGNTRSALLPQVPFELSQMIATDRLGVRTPLLHYSRLCHRRREYLKAEKVEEWRRVWGEKTARHAGRGDNGNLTQTWRQQWDPNKYLLRAVWHYTGSIPEQTEWVQLHTAKRLSEMRGKMANEKFHTKHIWNIRKLILRAHWEPWIIDIILNAPATRWSYTHMCPSRTHTHKLTLTNSYAHGTHSHTHVSLLTEPPCANAATAATQSR